MGLATYALFTTAVHTVSLAAATAAAVGQCQGFDQTRNARREQEDRQEEGYSLAFDAEGRLNSTANARSWAEFEERFEYGIWLGQDGREGLPYTSASQLDVDWEVCTVDRIAWKDLTPARFRDEYLLPSRPVIVTDAPRSLGWPAAGGGDGSNEKAKGEGFDWASLEGFAEGLAGRPVRFLEQAMEVSAAVRRMRRVEEEAAAVALSSVGSVVSAPLAYLREVREGYSPKPPVLDDGNIFPMLVTALNSIHMWNETFSHAYVVLGGKGAGTAFHKDGWDTAFWNCAVSGAKHWVLLAPSLVKALPGHVLWEWSEMHNHAWMAGPYRYLKQHATHIQMDECTQREGDLLWSPGGFYHLTLNTQSAVSVTENQISASSAKRVFRHVCYRDFAFAELGEDEGEGVGRVSYEENSHRTSMLGSVSACIALLGVELSTAGGALGGERGEGGKGGYWATTCCGNGGLEPHLDDAGRRGGERWPRLAGMPRAIDLWQRLVCEAEEAGREAGEAGIEVVGGELVKKGTAARVSNSRYYRELVRLTRLRPAAAWQVSSQAAMDASLRKLQPDPFELAKIPISDNA